MSKNKVIPVLLFLLVISTMAFILYETTNQNTIKLDQKNEIPEIQLDHDALNIALCSDFHLGSSDVGLVNPLGNYNEEMIDATIDDLINQQVDVLILCGDNTNSARIKQHEKVVERLKKVEEANITVLVIPGNHDIGTLAKEQFPYYYSQFGYKESISQDEISLSYSYVVDNTLFIMIDTDGYTDYKTAGLKKPTYDWIVKQIAFAKENHYSILPIGHYPILTNHVTGFALKEDVVRLFQNNEIPLYICGHLHGRSVSINQNLYELVIEQTPSYPCSYGILSISKDGSMQYNPKEVDIGQYARKIHSNDDGLLNFNVNQHQLFIDWCNKVVDDLAKNKQVSKMETDLAKGFFSKLLQHLYKGDLYDHLEELNIDPGHKIFEKIAANSNYGPWLPTLFENSNPYTKGFIIQKDIIQEIGE